MPISMALIPSESEPSTDLDISTLAVASSMIFRSSSERNSTYAATPWLIWRGRGGKPERTF